MKTLRRHLLVSLLLIGCSDARALSPVAPQPIEKRVEVASHIFIGSIVAVELAPSQNEYSFGWVAYTVKVENVMFPGNWHSHDLVQITGIHGIEYTEDSMIGRSFIFIVTKDSATGKFLAPTQREIKEPIEMKNEVIKAIYKRTWKGKETEPNHAMERSRILVTDRAYARSAPSIRLAHLGR